MRASERAKVTGDAEREAQRIEQSRIREARRVFMAARLIRPEGAGLIEFLNVHGFSYPDRGSAKVAHLTL